MGIDKNSGSLVYFNIDSMLNQPSKSLDLTKNVNQFGYVDKFYGYG